MKALLVCVFVGLTAACGFSEAGGSVTFRPDCKGDPVAVLSNRYGSCEVMLRGARVLTCAFANDPHPLLYSPKQSVDKIGDGPSTWYHGGVPLLWPWFGAAGRPNDPWWRQALRFCYLPVKGKPPFHATARYSLFKLVDSHASAEETSVTLTLGRCPEVCEHFDDEADFKLTYVVTLGRDRLTLALKTSNVGTVPFTYREGYHPYFFVGNGYHVKFGGFEGCEYTTFRQLPYDETHVWQEPFVPMWPGCDEFTMKSDCHRTTLEDPDFGRVITLDTRGSKNVVTWMPPSHEPGTNHPACEARRMVCLEPANMTDAAEITLEPGQSHVFETSISVSASRSGPKARPTLALVRPSAPDR